MDHDTHATVLFGLEGLAVTAVRRDEAGLRQVEVVTAEDTARVCPGCGVAATRVKQTVATRPRDLAHGGSRVQVLWRKRRWFCDQPGCRRKSFTEQVGQVPARARTTARLRRHAGRAVADGGRTVAQSARDHGLSWPVVHRELAAYAAEVLPEQPEPTSAVGIDETRRGKPVWEKDEQTGEWSAVADCWHVGFTDLAGGQGLLGQVEGRNSAAVVQWLADRGAEWCQQVTLVAIDMCAAFRAAVRKALPHATVVVDHFHIVQLANAKLAEARRRLTWQMRRRRGRAGDPEWDARRLLRRNAEDLTDTQRDTLERDLTGIGTYGKQILVAWKAKEKLRALLALARTHPARTQISHRLHQFFDWCAEHSYLPELVTLAETVQAWWPQIEAFIHTGATNAASEGTNRVIKLDARNAYGYRNPNNQRRRSRCATTRKTRDRAVPG
jgi:transposase